MPAKKGYVRIQPMGDPNDPQGMIALMRQYFEWMEMRNFSKHTIEDRRDYLRYFIDWAAARGVSQPAEVTKPIIERYQRFLYHFRKRNGDPLSFGSQYHRLVIIRSWFKWMARQNHILYNPSSDIDLPRLAWRLPKYVLMRRRSGTGSQPAQCHAAVGPPRPGYFGNLLFDGHPPHGNDRRLPV